VILGVSSLLTYIYLRYCQHFLQCFDSVGWATGTVSRLQKCFFLFQVLSFIKQMEENEGKPEITQKMTFEVESITR